MAIATFIENEYGSEVARALVYDTWWFEALLGLLVVSFTVNIFKYQLLRVTKLPLLLFHLGFIVILLGAAITRYTSYGGVMRIREDSSVREIISDENYLQLTLDGGDEFQSWAVPYSYQPWFSSPVLIDTIHQGHKVKVRFKDWIPDGIPQVVNDPQAGVAILQLMIAAGGESRTVFLKAGEVTTLANPVSSNSLFIQNTIKQPTIGFFTDEKDQQIETPDIVISQGKKKPPGELFIVANRSMSFLQMTSQEVGRIPAEEERPLLSRALYNFDKFSIATVKYESKGKITWVSETEGKDNSSQKEDIMLVEVSVDGDSQEIGISYRQGFLPNFQTNFVGGFPVAIAYGSIPYVLPFEIYLEDFILDRYPGSSSPSAYESKVVIRDGIKAVPYLIFMNNVLDYGGYRFFQASYDSDERGTVLSVNYDLPGTWISYFGYMLMGLGMCWALFGKHSRFQFLLRKLKHLQITYLVLLVIMMLSLPLTGVAQTKNFNNVFKEYIVPKNHADEFGTLLVQDLDGRVKPINTLALEFLRKISRGTSLVLYDTYTLSPDQVFLSLLMYPTIWRQIPLIKTEPKKWGKLQGRVQVNSEGLISFNSFLDENGDYLLSEDVKAAKQKKPAARNTFDHEMIKVDERFNILFNMLSGVYLRIFPKRDDPTKTWYSFTHDFLDFSKEDAQFVQNIIPVYFGSIQKAMRDQEWAQAEEYLVYIKKYQYVLGSDIIPSATQMEVEIWYNRINIFYWSFQLYWLLGILLLGLVLLELFINFPRQTLLRRVKFSLVILMGVVWFAQTVGLLMRWYIAERPPWTDGYEMIVFASWALVGFSFLFQTRSDFALPLGALFSGVLLFVSYLDWLNPEITELMPVLKSYWLKIHVAVIISSYAPLALSALLGLMAQVLMIIRNKKNQVTFDTRIAELTVVNELSMIAGIFLLSIGTFLGAVWANESWGRYWAWDPKETWSLISIVVYAIVLHLRLIPNFRGEYFFNTASVIAFFSIIMTSFGVNYYLSGLHSYASGDPLPIPSFVYIVIGGVALLAVFSYLKQQLSQSVETKQV